jgi:hypothetical protein
LIGSAKERPRIANAGAHALVDDIGWGAIFDVGSNVQLAIELLDVNGVINLTNHAGGFSSAAAAQSAIVSDGHGGAMLSLGAQGGFVRLPQRRAQPDLRRAVQDLVSKNSRPLVKAASERACGQTERVAGDRRRGACASFATALRIIAGLEALLRLRKASASSAIGPFVARTSCSHSALGFKKLTKREN